MARVLVALTTTILATTALLAPGPGVAGSENPNWFNTPVQGPSPNTNHIVGNTDGGECQLNGTDSAGLALGQPAAGLQVNVVLSSPDDAPIKAETYTPDENGDWGGDFDIPAGLDPGVYLLQGFCSQQVVTEPRSAGLGGSMVLGGGQAILIDVYEDRSYRVVGEAEEAGPVEAEVSLTG